MHPVRLRSFLALARASLAPLVVALVASCASDLRSSDASDAQPGPSSALDAPSDSPSASDASDASDAASDAPTGTCTTSSGRVLQVGQGTYDGCVIETCTEIPDGGATLIGEAVACDGGAPTCRADSDCGAGLWCVFPGDGCDTPGRCLSAFAAPSEDCTRDRAAFCGCDGTTFFASSSCPRQAYAHWGACP